MAKDLILSPKQAKPAYSGPMYGPETPDFVYKISYGTLRCGNGDLVSGQLYSGHGKSKNDPSAVQKVGEGPLPPGDYRIGRPRQSIALGPFVLDLVQLTGPSYGRALFRIHGDSKTHNASHGCIVAPRSIRELIDRECSSSRILRVTP